VAGNGTRGYSGDNGPATATGLDLPQSVAADSAGNIYIADTGDRRVREVSNGVITTVVAGLGNPTQVAVDSVGNVYISDSSGIRKVSGGIITTVAGGNGTQGFGGDGGPATSALLFGYYGIAVDPAGNLYIADAGNNRIRKVSNGIITTVAGNGTPGFRGDNGPATSAELNGPQSVAVDAVGNLYIADTYNYVIRKISNGIINTIAGTGKQGYSGDNLPALKSAITPTYLAVDSLGDVFFSEQYAYRVRELKPCTVRLARGRSAPDSLPCSTPPVFSPR